MNIVLNMHGIRRLGPSGVGTYSRGLVQGLSNVDRTNRYLIFAGKDALSPLPDNFTVETVDTTSKLSALYFQSIDILRRMSGFKPDVLHSLKTHLPAWRNCPAVITIHDLIFLRHPEFYPAHWKIYWKNVIHAAARRATAVITVSRNSADDIRELLGIPPEKIHVIHHGAPTLNRAAPSNNNGTPYFLYVGNITIRKNVQGVIRAFASVSGKSPGKYRLILVGNMDWGGKEALREIERQGISADVEYRGYVPNDDLQTLYANAVAFVYPSFYEGFGLPVLEAMAAGCAVISSKTSSLPEVAGDAAILVDPNDTEEIAAAMEGFATSPSLREAAIRKGIEQAARFSWNRAAEETLAVYRKAAGGSHA